nr:hypothetical protein [Pacificibacter marinus]
MDFELLSILARDGRLSKSELASV